MNKDREIERLKRMKAHQDAEFAELQKAYDELLEEANQPLEEVIALMEKLRNIEKEWSDALADINSDREEYKKLITDLKEMRDKAKRGRL